MEFDLMIDRNNRGEVRVLLAALFGMALLVAGSVVVAVNDVNSSRAHQIDLAGPSSTAAEFD